MSPTRRSLITGLGALLCAPALVRASSLMPVKAWAIGDETPRLLAKRTEHWMGWAQIKTEGTAIYFDGADWAMRFPDRAEFVSADFYTGPPSRP